MLKFLYCTAVSYISMWVRCSKCLEVVLCSGRKLYNLSAPNLTRITHMHVHVGTGLQERLSRIPCNGGNGLYYTNNLTIRHVKKGTYPF